MCVGFIVVSVVVRSAEHNTKLTKSFNSEKVDKDHLRKTLEKSLAKSKLYKETMEANDAEVHLLKTDKENLVRQIEDLQKTLDEKNSLNAKLQATLVCTPP